jgi:anti-anti-sigma factor
MKDDEQPLFELSREGSVAIVVPSRNISSLAEEGVENQWNELREKLLLGGATRVVIDFGRIEYFGSTMLEWMLSLWKPLKTLDGKMAICGISNVGQEILRAARLDQIWPMYAKRDDAVRELSA